MVQNKRVTVQGETDGARHRARPRKSQDINVVIVDDHPLMRYALRQIIEQEPDLQIRGEASGAPEAITMIDELRPQLVTVDLSLAEGSGFDLIKQCKALAPEVKVLVLSMHDESVYAERAIRAGAAGYLNKSATAATVREAIRRVLAGGIYLSPAASNHVLHRSMTRGKDTAASPIESLSDRELETFTLLGKGKTTREIADELHLAPKTVDVYRQRIKHKLGVTTTAELTRAAVEYVLQSE